MEGTLPQMQYKREPPISDNGLIKRIRIALDSWSENQPGSLSGQCHATLNELVESSPELHKGERRKIVVPYFGRVTGDRREGASQAADP
ncbi:hypothetical protein AnigIFM50267_009928 [Aspergillus niger]|nr:hypothetical protein AnigIFM50267_009928 [Aspergillus niger]